MPEATLGPVTVRDAHPSDREIIARFNEALAFESEHKRLDPVVLRRGVARVFERPELGRYFLAEADGQVIGQMMLTYELTDWRDGLYYWIQSVYTLPDYRGRGVFRTLYDHVIEVAKRSGDARCVKLYVEKANEGAIKAYERAGMEQQNFHIYEMSW